MKKFKLTSALILALSLTMLLPACSSKDIDSLNKDISDQMNSVLATESITEKPTQAPTEKPTKAPTEPKTEPPTEKPTISTNSISKFDNKAYIEVNGNVPYFGKEEMVTTSFENYSDLDSLGRCGIAYACVGKDLMPTEERGSIGSVKPSGWQTVKYDCVDGKYLYNRCHLIGYQLTGENANEKNLITGTRYLNIEGMLPFENMVADYVKETNNHVLYRVTPIYDGENLVASGVQMEGYSVEDNGKGISYNVYCYNNQPYVTIDYATGKSTLDDNAPSSKAENSQAEESSKESNDTNSYNSQQAEQTPSTVESVIDNTPDTNTTGNYVLNNNTKKFHTPGCSAAKKIKDSNRQDYTGSREDLIAQGYDPCKICQP